jgi:hypothetical protein
MKVLLPLPKRHVSAQGFPLLRVHDRRNDHQRRAGPGAPERGQRIGLYVGAKYVVGSINLALRLNAASSRAKARFL